MTMIEKSFLEHHHRVCAPEIRADLARMFGKPPNCTCPRETIRLGSLTCPYCKGKGERNIKVPLPKRGTLVTVKDPKLLAGIFGRGNEPTGPGRVYDIEIPEEHLLDLPTNLGVRVTWDKLTLKGEIPKGAEATLWTFDLLEIEVVK